MNKFNVFIVSIFFMIGCSEKEAPNMFENQVKVYEDSKNVEGQLQESFEKNKKAMDEPKD